MTTSVDLINNTRTTRHSVQTCFKNDVSCLMTRVNITMPSKSQTSFGTLMTIMFVMPVTIFLVWCMFKVQARLVLHQASIEHLEDRLSRLQKYDYQNHQRSRLSPDETRHGRHGSGDRKRVSNVRTRDTTLPALVHVESDDEDQK